MYCIAATLVNVWDTDGAGADIILAINNKSMLLQHPFHLKRQQQGMQNLRIYATLRGWNLRSQVSNHVMLRLKQGILRPKRVISETQMRCFWDSNEVFLRLRQVISKTHRGDFWDSNQWFLRLKLASLWDSLVVWDSNKYVWDSNKLMYLAIWDSNSYVWDSNQWIYLDIWDSNIHVWDSNGWIYFAIWDSNYTFTQKRQPQRMQNLRIYAALRGSKSQISDLKPCNAETQTGYFETQMGDFWNQLRTRRGGVVWLLAFKRSVEPLLHRIQSTLPRPLVCVPRPPHLVFSQVKWTARDFISGASFMDHCVIN